MSILSRIVSRLQPERTIASDYTDRILLGRMLAEFNNQKTTINNIQDVEFKVFSQWGDDGIIQYLINNIQIDHKVFVEFGVENYTEANTRFLLINNNWRGLIMDGDKANMDLVKNEPFFWRHDLTAIPNFITRENINQILTANGFTGNIGLLHIDIDGNDYYVWEIMDVIQPDIVIVEYNAVFGYEHPISIPYQADFYRTKAHTSNLYWGCSLNALCYLAEKKGYTFIGTNNNGNNAYFIINHKVGNLPQPGVRQGFTDSSFRESRNADGQLTYLSGANRFDIIKEMTVFDVKNRKNVILSSL